MNNATIQSSFNNGNITASANYLGGIVGYISNGSNVSNTYNRGEIKGSNYVGGITGYSVGAYSIRTYVNYSYNSGLVSGTANVNGVIGANGSHSYLSHVYYDTTVLADFDPGQGYIKPAITNNSYGKTSDFLLNSSLGTLGFNASIWELRSKSGDYDYYPQLTVFANNSNLLIKTDSLESVKIDVSYGFGTKDSPFLIKTEQDMHDLSLNVAKGNTYLNYHFKVDDGLTSFDLGDFIPIGSADNEFQGSFDGNGAEFKLNIDRPDSDYQGLFGFHRTGEIKNLSVSGTVRGRSYVGGIVGYQINSKVLNVYNEATILGEGNYAGGITGYLTSSSTIDYAYNTGEITGANYVGGIAGSIIGAYSSRSYIRNTYSRGKVSSKTSGNVNGVAVAGSYGYINNSYYDVIVIANYYQPEGYFKPSSLETATYAKNTSQLIYNNQGLLANSHFYFKEKTEANGYYPQLKVFSENEVTETASRSLDSVTIDISDGTGTKDLPFMIYNEDDLIEINNKVKNGNTFQGFYFKVADSVNKLEFENYEPIGTPNNPFYGSFDGNNKEFNINIETESDYQGLFGYFGIGKISNLYLTRSITGNDYVAGVVGRQISGNIENVYNLATVTGNSYVGGIVGHMNNATIQTSFNNGNITASANYLGGIVGYISNGSNVSNTYNRGEIKGSSYVGGIAGYIVGAYSNRANVNFAYNTGLISGTANVNGVIGASGSYTNLSRVYYDTSVLADFDPGQGYIKPAITNNSYGKTSDFLLNSNHNTLGFNENIWELRSKSGDYDYYPQLTVFANNSNLLIKTDSLESVKIDVSYGFGTKDSPFLIKTEQDMHDLSLNVAKGNTYLNYHFKVNDGLTSFDLGDFIPIGSADNEFQGSFDGNGAEFKLNIDRPDSDYQGLFGFHRTGEIKNLSVSGTVRGRSYVGGIVGYQINSKVLNVYNEATILGEGNYAGGITGYLTSSSTIDYAYNTGEITGANYVGGIAGSIIGAYSSRSYIRNTYSRGKVSSKTSGNVNGVAVAGSHGYISNSYYDVIVIANYYQPEGYFKPSSLETATYAKNTSQLIYNNQGLLANSHFYFEPKTTESGYYPQLKVFSENEVTETASRSLESVTIDISGGVGTFDLPFMIYNEDDLIELNSKVKNGNTFQGFYFKVDDSVERLEFENYEPIGTSDNPFYGSFDGNNKEFNINIESESDYQGLFGYFGIGKISNLYVTGSITGNDYVAGVVGRQISGNIENVYNLATVTGNSYVGGIVGHMNNATIQTSFNNGNITASANYLGGIVGYISNSSNVSNTYNRGEIKGGRYVGGIAGYSVGAYSIRTYINYAYSAGLVSGTANVNGVIGANGSHSYLSHVYYEVSMLRSFEPGEGYIKPSSTVSSQGLDKTSMFGDLMSTKGFNSNIWSFKEIEGNYAYYPQIKYFAENCNEHVRNDSIISVRTNPFTGDGTKESPYLIRNVKDMVVLSHSISEEYDALGVYYLVESAVFELNLVGTNFIPIGQEVSFKGNFDGNYAHFIININKENENFVGLFGNLSSDANVSNLSISGDVKGKNYVGGISGRNEGNINNVYAKVNVNGNQNVGGIIGYNKGYINTTFSTGNVIGNQAVGGLIGFNDGSIEEAYYGGKIQGKNNVGALIGFSSNEEISKLNYNGTIIYYDDIITDYIKPINAVGNNYTFNHFNVAKEQLTGLDVFNSDEINLTNDLWITKETNGLYDYYPQIEGFAEHESSVVRNNSSQYASVIRFATGSGSKSNPYIIRNEDDMKALSDITKSNNLLGIYFKVLDGVTLLDLTNPDLGFESIGHSANINQQFRGGFDGNGVTIKVDLNNNKTYVGLFGYIGSDAEIKRSEERRVGKECRLWWSPY